MVMFLTGAVMLVIGMGFFQLGGGGDVHDTAGRRDRGADSEDPLHSPDPYDRVHHGAVITISEPDLQVLAEQVPSIPNHILILGSFYDTGETVYTLPSVAEVGTTRDVVREFLVCLPPYMKEVFTSFIPVAAVFLIFQMLTHRYQRRQVKRVLVGFGYTYIGLVLFICGVNVGFSPVGSFLGSDIASASCGNGC